MKSRLIILFSIGLIGIGGATAYLRPSYIGRSIIPPQKTFIENFDNVYTVKEEGNIKKSNSPYWWLSSGGYFYSLKGVGSTILGPLLSSDPMRLAFYNSNPTDTDNGYHPQNIFRLTTKRKFQNFTQEAYFEIINDNLSTSPNRNESNGVLFFNRYLDEYNLYYVGLRVDGYAVIKKKIKGTYYTMDYKPLITDSVYDREKNPNLLPKNTWIGLKSEINTDINGYVNIKLYVDKNNTGNWVLMAQATDDGKSYGGDPILKEGYGGIRTDFMDVEFEKYKISEQ